MGFCKYQLCSCPTAQVEYRNPTASVKMTSNNTNSSTDLARVADRVQTSACNRSTRLMIWDGFL
eukprot:1490869-Pyramimonas_sp.AAC.1